jgi:hypothetical protein
MLKPRGIIVGAVMQGWRGHRGLGGREVTKMLPHKIVGFRGGWADGGRRIAGSAACHVSGQPNNISGQAIQHAMIRAYAPRTN